MNNRFFLKTSLQTLGLALLAAASVAGHAAPPAVIARGQANQPGLRVEVNEVRRTGNDMVTVRMTVINDGREQGYVSLWESGMLDIENRLRFRPVNNGNPVNCLCSEFQVSVPPTGRTTAWVRFAAPAAGVRRVGIELPKFEPIDNVPVTE